MQTVLVTGGGGFLGKAIVQRLLQRGLRIRSYARGDYPELRSWGVEVCRGDLTELHALSQACAGCDTIFHVAAKAGIWGSYDSYYQANVVGTQHVLQVCRQQQIPRLIYTSSPSVVFIVSAAWVFVV